MIRIILVCIFAVLLGMGSGFSMLSQKDRPLALLRLPVSYLLFCHASDLLEKRKLSQRKSDD
jgi:lipoprotein signal peptidase